MAENKITLALDLDDISDQLKPMVETLQKHYKEFLQEHHLLIEQLTEENKSYQKQINEQLENQQNSMHDYFSDTKKEIEAGIKNFEQKSQEVIANTTTKMETILKDYEKKLSATINSVGEKLIQCVADPLIQKVSEGVELQLKNVLVPLGREITLLKSQMKNIETIPYSTTEDIADLKKSIKNLEMRSSTADRVNTILEILNKKSKS